MALMSALNKDAEYVFFIELVTTDNGRLIRYRHIMNDS